MTTIAAALRSKAISDITVPRIGALGLVSLITAALVVAPIAAVVWNIFLPSEATWEHLISTVLPEYIANTFLLLVLVAAGVVCCGVLSAWLVTAYEFPGRRVLEWALVLPMAIPAYVMAYAYTDWLQTSGPVQSILREFTGWRVREYWFPEIRSLPGAATMLSLALYPYVYLLTRGAFLEQSRSSYEAAQLAGYGAWGRFWHVSLPLARTGIVAGVALALMETLADFGTVSYFAVNTFTAGIYRAWLSLGDSVAAGQLATCLLVFVLAMLALERMHRGDARYTSNRTPITPQRLGGVKAMGAFALCAIPIAFGFMVPAAILLELALTDPQVQFGARITGLITNTFILAGIAAIAAVVVAMLLAYAARTVKSPLVQAANRLAVLGYALPGAVIAVGILPTAGQARQRHDRLDLPTIWRAHRIDFNRFRNGAHLCLSRQISRRGVSNGRSRADSGDSVDGRCRAQPWPFTRPHPGAGAYADYAQQHRHRSAARIRRRYERTTGDLRHAAV